MLKNYVQTGPVTKGEKGAAGFRSMVPQGALHTAQMYFIFCGIAAKCFINPRQGYAAKFTDDYRRLQTITDKGMKKICPFLSVSVRICPYAKHNDCFCQNPFFSG